MSESQNIEWKQSWHDDYLKWICGFANAVGGTIIIGKDDDGTITHLENYKALMESLPNKIRENLGIICDVNLHDDNDKKYIEIRVNPYTVPVSLRGRYYYRSGSSKMEMTGTTLNDFLLKKAGKTWDDVLEEGAKLSDIAHESLQLFCKDAIKSGRMSDDVLELSDSELLDKLRLLNGNKIKRAGIILFGKDPNYFYPNIKVKIGRFGNDDADLRFQEVIEGNIIELLQEVPQILNAKFLIKAIDFEGMQRIEKNEYPVAAIREMLLNALVHRSYMGSMIQLRVYNDKLTIWNEGTLADGMELESLKRHHISRPRNPLIADVCFKAGYIDSWGRGTLKIYNSCQEAGLPEPQITVLDGGILVAIYKKTNDQVNDQVNDQANNKLKASYDSLVKIVMESLSIKKLTEKQYAKYLTLAKGLSDKEISILNFATEPKSNKEIQENLLDLKKHNDNFKNYIEPLLTQQLLRRTLPNVPNSPLQKYFTSDAGKVILLIVSEERK